MIEITCDLISQSRRPISISIYSWNPESQQGNCVVHRLANANGTGLIEGRVPLTWR